MRLSSLLLPLMTTFLPTLQATNYDELFQEVDTALKAEIDVPTARSFFILSGKIEEPLLRQQVIELSLLAFSVDRPERLDKLRTYLEKKYPDHDYMRFLESEALSSDEAKKAAYRERLSRARTTAAAVHYQTHLESQGASRAAMLKGALSQKHEGVFSALKSWYADPSYRKHAADFQKLSSTNELSQECQRFSLILTALYHQDELSALVKKLKDDELKALVYGKEGKILSYDHLYESLEKEARHLIAVLTKTAKPYEIKVAKVSPAKTPADTEEQDKALVIGDITGKTPEFLAHTIKETGLYINRANRSEGKTLFKSIRGSYDGKHKTLNVVVTGFFLDQSDDAKLGILDGLLKFWIRRLRMNRSGTSSSGAIAIFDEKNKLVGGGTGTGEDIWFE